MLTVPQLQAIKAWVIANNASAFDQSAVNLLNAPATPEYWILKTELPINEVMENGYDWTIVDNETVGQARIWDRMTRLGTINPSKIFTLKGIGEAYKGNSPVGTQAHRRAIFGHCVRQSRVWEKLFAVATADWNVASNVDKTGARGANVVSPYAFNPDTCGVGSAGEFLSGLITLDQVVASESA